MGLFGALFAGVSGLDSQSNKIGIISNNISNVNTIGYKQGSASFNTLVVPSGTTTFSPGGVIGSNRSLVNQQGLIQATSSSTDIAISGGGMFVVNSDPSGAGSTLLTRSGSFTEDALGNFKNANGYYLQGFPLNGNGSVTNQNFSNLKTVNISASATGTASSTSKITLAANLNASQSVLLGSGEVTSLSNDNANAVNNASQIIVPTGANKLVRGDTLQIISGNSTVPDTFTYGGFTYGRDITAAVGSVSASAASGKGDNTDLNAVLDTQTNASVTVSNAGVLTFTPTNIGDYASGKNISLSGITTNIGGYTPAQLNGEFTATVSGGTVSVNLGVTAAGSTGTATVSNRTYPFQGNVLDATTPTGAFFNTTKTSSFAPAALSFKISSGGNTTTFTYNAQPDATQGQFNSLATLTTAINDSTGLTANLVGGKLYISGKDANTDVTFSNGLNAADATTGLASIDWVQELGLKSVLSASDNGSPPVHRFNSLQGLANKVNLVDPANLVASINNPNGASSLNLNEADPKQTISFSDGTGNTGSLITEFGFSGVGGASPTLIGGSANSYTTGTLPVKYDPTNTKSNMSSGAVAPQFTKDVTIYDAQGYSHTVAFNFAKIGVNTWAAEVAAVPASDVTSVTGDGQLAAGTITFYPDGSLAKVDSTLVNAIKANWTNGSAGSSITLNLGTSSKTDGLIQTASAFNVSVANQNGTSVGQLTGVSIDANGFVIANFSNGQTSKEFQVPLASVNNPNGLEAVSGDAYMQTLASGVENLQLAGTNGVGTISTSALEQSNVDISKQLTDLIVAQQAYGANSKILTVADQLLQQLDQIIQ